MKTAINFLVVFFCMFSSCTILYYNYRARYVAEYRIPRHVSNQELGELIYANASTEKDPFYGLQKSPDFDSLEFYGPDYHTLKYTMSTTDSTTLVKFDYFGYNGWRKNPPRKVFIEQIRNLLLKEYHATELIVMDNSNEKYPK
ncbi:MAG: hypothetical protein ACKVOK_00735 [Flavobacteriales bacterium]